MGAQVYQFLLVNCCQICGAQCPGGMSCLLPFIVFNTVNVFFAITMAVLRLATVRRHQDEAEAQGEPSQFAVVVLSAFAACLIGSYLAQALAAIFGFQAYRQAILMARQGAEAAGLA